MLYKSKLFEMRGGIIILDSKLFEGRNLLFKFLILISLVLVISLFFKLGVLKTQR
jgi:hypothetical protein